MRRIVLDTSVLVSALRNRRGASYLLLRHIALRVIVPVATQSLFFEYEAVLKRPEQRLVSGLSLRDIDVILEGIADATEAVDVKFRWRPQLPDADDEMVLEAAINGYADAIVTFNIKDFLKASSEFGIPVMLPSALVKELQT
jgi:putative PIN family toxin of toxin-antitoxin system